MDHYDTGSVPRTDNFNIQVRVRTDVCKAHITEGLYQADAARLSATSDFLRVSLKYVDEHEPIIDLFWPDLEAVDGYFQWLQDRIVHSIPVRASTHPQSLPQRKLRSSKHQGGNLARDQDNRNVQEKQDFKLLVRLWMFGVKVQDVTFRDTVMSLMEWMVKEPGAEENFVAAMTPSLIDSVWEMTADQAKIRAFLLETIVCRAPHAHIVCFLSDGSYHALFRMHLRTVFNHAMPLYQIGGELSASLCGLRQILLPFPPYTADMIGERMAPLVVHPYPVFADAQDGMEARLVRVTDALTVEEEPVHSISSLTGEQMQTLVRWVIKRDEVLGMCKYHEHGADGVCWWDAVPEQETGIEHVSDAAASCGFIVVLESV